MPMHVLGNVRIIHNVDDHGLSLAHPQEGTGDFITVADGADDNLRSQLDHHGCDSQGEIDSAPGGLCLQRRPHRMLRLRGNMSERQRLRERGPQLTCACRDHGGAAKPHKIPAIHLVSVLLTMPTQRAPPFVDAMPAWLSRTVPMAALGRLAWRAFDNRL